MSPTGTVLYRTGGYGTTVIVVQRPKGSLALRFTKIDGKQTDKALGHLDEKRAKQQARALSRELAKRRASNSGAPAARAGLTLSELFARYTIEVSRHKKGDQPAEDERRRTIWQSVLGPDRRVTSITPADVKSFIARRSAGQIVVDGIELKKKVKPRTVDADVVFLQSVCNWAVDARLVDLSPIQGAKRPDVGSQLRPIATHADYLAMQAVTARVHPRLPLLLACARYLGWRVDGILHIDGFDLDRAKAEHAPFGRLRKNWMHDKEGVDMWVPIPQALRQAFDDAGVLGQGWVFTSPKKAGKPMSRYHARDLFQRAEELTKVTRLVGGMWHPYRRLWATERKHLPTPDVAAAAGWRDQRTVQKYQQTDPATISAVMLFDANAQTKTGATSGTSVPKKRARGGSASA